MRKLLLTFLFLLLAIPSYSAIEDFTTWDLLDGTGLTVTSGTISMDAGYEPRQHNDHVRKDFTAGGITNFSWDFDLNITEWNPLGGYADFSLFRLTDDSDVYVFQLEIDSSSSSKNIYIRADGSNTKALALPNSNGISRYFTIKRYNDIMAIYVYQNADRSDTPSQVNIQINTSGGLRYLYAFHTTAESNTDDFEGSIANFEQGTAPTEALSGPPVIEPTNPYPADWDYKGGWKGKQSQKRKFFQETLDHIGPLHIYDSDADYPTIADEGYDITYLAVQPDANIAFTFVACGNDEEHIFACHPDRIEDVVIEGTIKAGDMEDSPLTHWKAIGSPSTLSQVGTFSVYQRNGDNHLLIEGADTEGVYVGTLAIDTLEPDCSTDVGENWTDKMEAVGFIKVESGTVNLEIIDGDGSTQRVDMQVGTAGGTTPKHWESFHTGYFTTTYSAGCGSGEMRFTCDGGACSFRLDEIKLGAVEAHGGALSDTTYMDNYGDEFEVYRVFHDWEPQYFAENRRWYMINPLGNVYFLKGANNFDYNQIKGRSGTGYGTPCGDYKSRIGSSASCTGVTPSKQSDITSLGITDIGFMYSVENKGANPHSNINRVDGVDMKQGGNFLSEDGTAGFFEVDRGSPYQDDWLDVYDPDWERQIRGMVDREDELNTLTEFYGYNELFNSPSTNFNNYKYGPLRALADINGMGWNLGNEPNGSANGWCNPMNELMVTGTFATDSSNDNYSETYIAQLNWLRAKYGDPTTEGTFLDNIGYAGANELSLVGTDAGYGKWTDVTGYDATDTDVDGTPDKDEDAIARLNLAWAGTQGTLNMATERGDGRNAWTLMYNGVDIHESGDLDGTCLHEETDWLSGYYEDVQDMLGNYNHRFHRLLYDYYFGPDGDFHERKLNFTFGAFGHDGWFRGFRVREDGKKVIRAVAGLGTIGENQSGPGFLTPYEDQYTLVNKSGVRDITFRQQIQDAYDDSGGDLGAGQGVPMYGESVWYTSGTAEHYSRTGTVDLVIDYNDATYDYRQATWNCDNLTADVDCFDTTESLRIPAQTAIYWNCTDTSDTGTCSDSGVMVYQYSRQADQPEDRGEFSSQVWFYTNTASIGNTLDEDVFTDGTRKFSVVGTTTAWNGGTTYWTNDQVLYDGVIYRAIYSPNHSGQQPDISPSYWDEDGVGTTYSAIIDWSQNFYPSGFKSRHVYSNLYNTTTVYNLDDIQGTNGHVIDSDPADGLNWSTYYMIRNGTVNPHAVSAWKYYNVDAGYVFDGIRANFIDVNAGDDYAIGMQDPNANPNWPDQFFLMDSQEKRARGFVEALKQNLDFEARNGDKIWLGPQLWAIQADYGYSDYTAREVRGFGAWSAKANKKDGIENTCIGADGIEGTNDDEDFCEQGDFTSYFSRYLKSIYNWHK